MTETFGRYTIEQKLGEGGMAEVFLAYDPELGRRVALKIITSDDPEMLERFHLEARAIAGLSHPNIVQVHEAGTIDERHYFVMDYVEGASLDKFIGAKRTVSGIQNVAKIVMQVALALHYAHTNKIVHRDIKPANILIDKNGKVFLTDFGLAKQIGSLKKSLTMTGSIMGTPHYMAPEQAAGKKHEIDRRTDIFSLGATLYHCITGRLPFEGQEIYETFMRIINDEPAPPTEIIPTIPKDLEVICLKCLEKDKANRYQTARELALDIKRYLEDEPISARPTGRITHLWRRAAKNKPAAIGITSAVLILIVVILYGWLSSAAQRREQLSQSRRDAYDYFEQGQYETAISLCDKVLTLAPLDEEITYLRGQCQKSINRKEEKTNLTKEQQQRREKAKIVLDRANGIDDADAKIPILQEAIEIDPTFGEPYQSLGYAYKRKKDYKQAVYYFSRAIESTPNLPYSYYERASIRVQMDWKIDEALADYGKVLQYDPHSHIGWHAKGSLEYHKRKYNDAISSFTKAIELYPNFAEAYYDRGIAYYGKSDIEHAFADFTEVLRLNPKNDRAWYRLGNVNWEKNHTDQALENYTEAIKLNSNHLDAYLKRGNLYFEKGDRDRAIADYTELIKLFPVNDTAYANRGNAYYKKGDMGKAMADYEQALKLNPKNKLAYKGQADIYNRKNAFDTAITHYTELLRTNPNEAPLYICRANSYSQKGDYERSAIIYLPC
ncbi:MAG: tetratricopeptide repeat protein [Planctomycetes bacterium]|nr:tetratricopeptide repeat protein [Planctomycetota bacterium]